MRELKLYEISEEYISYISTVEKNVFSSKENDRNHTRKYLGIVYSINGYNYYIPLSSPKNSDYRMENRVQKIRGSIVPIIRITSQSSSGELELKGTIKYPAASNGVFDPRGIRQMCMQACPLDSLLAGINKM